MAEQYLNEKLMEQIQNRINNQNKLTNMLKSKTKTAEEEIISATNFKKSYNSRLNLKPTTETTLEKQNVFQVAEAHAKNNEFLKRVFSTDPNVQDKLNLFGLQETINNDLKLNVSSIEQIDYDGELKLKLNSVISNPNIVQQIIDYFNSIDIEYIKEFANNYEEYELLLRKIPKNNLNYSRIIDVLTSQVERKLNERGILDVIKRKEIALSNSDKEIQILHSKLFRKIGNRQTQRIDDIENISVMTGLFSNFYQSKDMKVNQMESKFKSNNLNDKNFLKDIYKSYKIFIENSVPTLKEIINEVNKKYASTLDRSDIKGIYLSLIHI
jgi:hypothetical protein